MRIFHHLVFDGWVNSSTSIANYSKYIYSADLGTVDIFHIGGYATQVSGTSPTLTIGTFGTYDSSLLQSFGVSPVSSLALSTSQETLFQGVGPNPATGLQFPRVVLNVQMGGTNPRGYFRIWVTGRDVSRRSRSMMRQVTDMAELAPPPM